MGFKVSVEKVVKKGTNLTSLYNSLEILFHKVKKSLIKGAEVNLYTSRNITVNK